MLNQLFKLTVFILLISNTSSTYAANTVADFVFANGKIYTVNPAQPWAEAVVVKGDKIIYVGDSSVAQTFIGKETKYRDLGGKMMMPGFIEGHFHTTIGATFGQGLWLAHLDTKEEVLSAVRRYIKDHPEKKIIMGFGWKTFTFPETGLKIIGMVSKESEDFNLTPVELLKYIPANTEHKEHKNSCNIGTEFYNALKAKGK